MIGKAISKIVKKPKKKKTPEEIKKKKGQLFNKRIRAKEAEYKAMGGEDKAKAALAKVEHFGLRGVARPIAVDIAIYEAQKYIRELAKKAGMSVKKWRAMNLKNKWVKQLHKHKKDIEASDKKKAAFNDSKAK